MTVLIVSVAIAWACFTWGRRMGARVPSGPEPTGSPDPVELARSFFLAAVSERAPDALLALDVHGRICAENATTSSLFSTDGESLVGLPAAMLFTPEHRDAFQCFLDEVIESGGRSRAAHELTAVHRDGSPFSVEVYLGVAASGDEPVVTLAVRDVTARQRVDRLKREFISLVSHELRTPLTSIRGSLGLLTTGRFGEISPQAEAMVLIAHSNSERLVRLINDLLDLEKMESGVMAFNTRTMRILPILEQALESNRGYAEQFGVKIVLKPDPPDPLVRVDPDRLTQVITNLLSNAVKFSPSGEKVVVELSHEGTSTRVSVTDRGGGIPVEFRSRIFERFAQADSSDARTKGGTGLGLSIAKSIVENLGGTISYATSDEGSTFFFDLPSQGDADGLIHASEGAGFERTHPHFRMRSRVLLRVDDRDLAARMGTILTRGGFKPDVIAHQGQLPPSLSLSRYAALVVALPLGRNAPLLPPSLRNDPSLSQVPTVLFTDGCSVEQLDPLRVVARIQQPLTESDLLNAVTTAVLPPRQANRRVVLHVDKDAATRKVVSGILEEIAATRAAADFDEAFHLLQRERFDLLLLDPSLPDGWGLDLLNLLSSQEPVIPVVLFSEYEIDREVAESVEASLVKSTTSDALLQSTVASLLGKRSSGRIAEGGAGHGRARTQSSAVR
jgi:PAS domain S-box-containing protein